MKIYLFGRNNNSRQKDPAFRVYYVLENLKVIKNLCIIYFGGVVFVLMLSIIFKVDLDRVVTLPGFSLSLYISLVVSPLCYFISWLLISKFKSRPSFLNLSQTFVILFSMYTISRGMLNTFNAMHNPRNSLTMYMIWLIAISVFFIFEYFESILIVAFCLGVFSILLPRYQFTTTEIIKNQAVSCLVLAMFYFLSRNVYSYRAKHFFQLKTIREKNLEIENANHLKDEILGIVAHDLRNPLSAIESMAMMMAMDDIIKADEDAKENLMVIRASCEKARFIINDLLEAARNESLDNFGVEEVELNAFLADVIKQWQTSKSPSHLVFSGTKKLLYTRLNKEKMQRVMDNLISNAIKFSGDDNPIEILLKQVNDGCIIEVKDFGLGISEEMLPYVFDRFSKAGRRGVRGEDSVGMGLNIARQIINKHGGDITVESTENKGTTFTIALPQ